MAKRKSTKPENKPRNPTPSTDGRPTPDGDGHLAEAVAHPGAVEIPEDRPQPGAGPVVEIPADEPRPGEKDTGTPLEQDPDLTPVPLGRPNPYSWVQVFPDRQQQVLLLPLPSGGNGPPTLHWVANGLRGSLIRELKLYTVHLLYDVGGAGEPFLWAVPQHEQSPYYNSLSMILAKGPEFLARHLFRIARAELGKRVCEVRVRPRTPDDPLPRLPTRPISQLLPAALGREQLITDTSHPVYVTLTTGGRLS
jgi:hypothetical protein